MPKKIRNAIVTINANTRNAQPVIRSAAHTARDTVTEGAKLGFVTAKFVARSAWTFLSAAVTGK